MFPLPPVTDEQRRIIDAMAALSRERFAARAARYDAESAFPYNQSKAYSADVGLMATERALRLAGGRGILKELPLERWPRDARAGPVMPPANDRCLETAGKLLCGLRAATLEFQ